MESTDNAVEQPETEGQTEDLVPVTEATDEDLAYSREGFEKYGEDFFDPNFQIPEEAQPDGSEGANEVDSEAKTDGSSLQKEETAAPPANLSQEEIDKKFAAIQKQIDGQELLLKRRASDNAVMRQQLKDYAQKLNAVLDEKFAENPREGLAIAEEIKKTEATIQQLDNQDAQMYSAHAASSLIARHIRPGEVTIDDVAGCLKADGLSDEDIADFKRSPETAGSPTELLYLFQRAKAERLLRQVVVAYRKLESESKVRAEKRTESVLTNVNKALRRTPSVNGSSGSGSPSNPVDMALSPAEIAALSDAELKELKARISR